MNDCPACPSCGKKFRVSARLTGKRIRCGHCQSVFVVPPLRFAEEEDEEEERGRRRSDRSFRDQEDEDEETFFEERERRPRKRRDRLSRAEVRQMVQLPGMALMLIGIMSVLQWLLIMASILAAVRTTVGGIILLVAFICLMFSGATIRGGFNMMRLIGHRTAMECSVFAMLPFCCCCMLGLPIGIWSLIVLRQPGVKEVFARDSGRTDGY